MRTIDAMKKLARNDGRFTHVYTKKELSELFNETGSKLNGTLKSLIKENILNRAYHNVYVFRFSQYGGLGTLDLIGKKIRPNDSFYESLESSASAWSLISQIPTVVTYMTTGKSKWYNTGYGSIDFVHYSKTDEKPRTIDRSSMGRVPLADKLQTYRDLQKTKRSLDLLREQYDKDHGCRDGNIQYYVDGETDPCFEEEYEMGTTYQVNPDATAAGQKDNCLDLVCWYTDPEYTQPYESQELATSLKLYGYNPCSVKYDTTTRSSVLDTSYNWSTDADLGTALDLAALYPQDEIVKYGTKLTFAGPWSAWCEDAGKTRCVSSTPGVYATAGASGSPILSATIKGNTTVYVDWPWSGYDGVMSARS